MKHFASPGVAIGFGAFFLCAETCLHADRVLNFASRPLDLPIYDWSAGAFLVVAGVLSHREWSTARRQYQVAAWGFMLSLLVGASFSMLDDWRTPPEEDGWLSEGWFVVVLVTMTLVALGGLVSSLTAPQPGAGLTWPTRPH